MGSLIRVIKDSIRQASVSRTSQRDDLRVALVQLILDVAARPRWRQRHREDGDGGNDIAGRTYLQRCHELQALAGLIDLTRSEIPRAAASGPLEVSS